MGAWLGSGHVTNQVTVGVLTPHAAPGPEVELPEMASGPVTTQVARVSVAGDGDTDRPPVAPSELSAAAAPDVLAKAAAGFTPGSIDVIGYASTTSAYAIGGDAESDRAGSRRRVGLPTCGRRGGGGVHRRQRLPMCRCDRGPGGAARPSRTRVEPGAGVGCARRGRSAVGDTGGMEDSSDHDDSASAGPGSHGRTS